MAVLEKQIQNKPLVFADGGSQISASHGAVAKVLVPTVTSEGRPLAACALVDSAC